MSYCRRMPLIRFPSRFSGIFIHGSRTGILQIDFHRRLRLPKSILISAKRLLFVMSESFHPCRNDCPERPLRMSARRSSPTKTLPPERFAFCLFYTDNILKYMMAVLLYYTNSTNFASVQTVIPQNFYHNFLCSA